MKAKVIGVLVTLSIVAPLLASIPVRTAKKICDMPRQASSSALTGGIVKAEGLGAGPTHRQVAIAKQGLTMPPGEDASSHTTSEKPAESRVRFAPVHVYLDSGDKPLAAYQFELVCSVPVRAYSPGENNASRRHWGPQTRNSAFGEPRYERQIKIVGVEGGEHPAFRQAPYYDPAALMNDRIIIAAFNAGSDLPHGRTRIATIHLQILGDAEPQYELKLVVAADTEGEDLVARLTLETGEQK